MRIVLANAKAADSLQEHLERCECIVTRVDERTLEVAAAPRSFRADLAQLELKGYVSVWRELNPEAELTIVTSEIAGD